MIELLYLLKLTYEVKLTWALATYMYTLLHAYALKHKKYCSKSTDLANGAPLSNVSTHST